MPNRDLAYQEVKRRILDNEWPPGTQMLETEVAGTLGMSRTPVREALIRLSDEGLVDVRPRHGMVVTSVSPRDMEEIYEILTSLEATAAHLVAERGLSSAELMELERTVADMNTALETDDLVAWAKADEAFHWTLIRLSGNKRLHDILLTVWDQQHRARMATLHLRPKPHASNRDHEEVISAIRERDPERAYQVHMDHRRKSGKMLVGLLREHGIANL